MRCAPDRDELGSRYGAFVVACTADLRRDDTVARTFSVRDARGVAATRRAEADALLRATVASAGLDDGGVLLVFERMREYAKTMREPTGACAFCLRSAADARAGAAAAQDGCFHAFHLTCWRDWDAWTRAREAEAQTVTRTTRRVDADAIGTRRCPTCRRAASAADVARFRDARVPRDVGTSETSDGNVGACALDASEASTLGDALARDAAFREALEDTRARFARATAAQRAAGGVVDPDADGCGIRIDARTRATPFASTRAGENASSRVVVRACASGGDATSATAAAAAAPPRMASRARRGASSGWLARAASRMASSRLNGDDGASATGENSSDARADAG